MTEIPEHLRRRAESARLAAAGKVSSDLPLHLQEAPMGRGGMIPGDPRPCVIAGGTHIHGLVGPFESQEMAHAYYQTNQPYDAGPYLAPPLLKAVLAPNAAALERAREMLAKQAADQEHS